MSELVQAVGWVNLVAYCAVAVAAMREWRRGRARAAPWAVAAFGALALVIVAGRLLPDDPSALVERTVGRTVIVVLLLFPYLLYRFSSALRRSSTRSDLALAAMTLAIALWTFAAPPFPAPGDPRPGWFVAYLVAFLAHWAVFSVVVAVRLWRAGSGQPSVARRRMRLLAVAAATLTVALFVTVAGGSDEVRLVSGLLATAGAVLFLLALSPPWFVRAAWRRPEQERLRLAVGELMLATSEEEVGSRVLEPMAQMVGARALALYGADGRLVGTYGGRAEPPAQLAEGAAGSEAELERIDFDGGTLLVRSSPYAPYFGGEELSLLRSLADLTGLALDRSRLFAQERAARTALERADEIKSNFIALAAHELRTPVAAVHGVAETLHARGHELSEDRRAQLRRVLLDQSTRLRLLVEQLLDLSRLEADAVAIEPRPVPVRERVLDIVAGVVGTQTAEGVEVDVPEELEAALDPAAFDRILTNLVVNATRYGSPPIRVTAELRDRHFRLTVEDRGPGVPAELVPDLFERFTRGADARAGAVGSGLGLSIARSYAQAHRGDLLYERAEPHGARFQLVLPVDPQDVEGHVRSRARPPRAVA